MFRPLDMLGELIKIPKHMIEELSKDQKADCPKHLPELVMLTNSSKIGNHWVQPTLLDVWALTVLTHWPLLFYNMGHGETHVVLTNTFLGYMNDCKKPSRKFNSSPLLRLRDRSSTMTERLMPFGLNQSTWSWLKADVYKGEEESEGLVGGGTIQWYARSLSASFYTSWWMSGQDFYEFSTKIDFFSSPPVEDHSLLYGPVSWVGRGYHHHPRAANSR